MIDCFGLRGLTNSIYGFSILKILDCSDKAPAALKEAINKMDFQLLSKADIT
jgi:hypothetical protein